jgi:drug/metabolite transporter (DMT)-like permease
MPARGKLLEASSAPNVVLGGLSGGVAAPALLALALKHSSATSVSMMLNIEVVFNFVVARLLFHERTGPRTCAAAAAALSSAVLVSAGEVSRAPATAAGISLAAACALAWTIDNVASQALCDRKPRDTAAGFALVGGVASTGLALAMHETFPDARHALALMGIGVAALGMVNPLYSLAQREIGAARSGSIFSVSPFVGALAAWAMHQGHVGPLMSAGAGLLLLGVYLQATEKPAGAGAPDVEAEPEPVRPARPPLPDLAPVIQALAPAARVRPLVRRLAR